MAIADGVSATASNFNAAFLSRTQDSSTVGVINLDNTANPNSGNEIVNLQRAVNELFDADGTSGEGDAARKNYSSNVYIADGDSRKTAIEKLDAAVALIDGASVAGPISSTDRGVAVFDNVDGDVLASTAVIIDESDNVLIPGTLTITGDLTVNGTTTTVNSATLDVVDQNILVNDGGNDATAQGAGLTVERTTVNGSLIYDENVESKWKIGDESSEIEVAIVSGSQVFTNKDIDGGTASNTSRITIPANTYANLSALTRKAGTILYATDQGRMYFDNGTSLSQFGGEPSVELRTISGGEETAKQLTLAGTPLTANKTGLEIKGFPSQYYGDDFTVSGTTLSWSGLGLDGILAAGDKVKIIYWA